MPAASTFDASQQIYIRGGPQLTSAAIEYPEWSILHSDLLDNHLGMRWLSPFIEPDCCLRIRQDKYMYRYRLGKSFAVRICNEAIKLVRVDITSSS